MPDQEKPGEREVDPPDLETARRRIQELEAALAGRDREIQALTQRVQAVENSRAWRWAEKYRLARQTWRRLLSLARKAPGRPEPGRFPEADHSGPAGDQPRAEVLFVSHDAGAHGAQFLLLHFLRWFKEHGKRPFFILLKNGQGGLRPEFEALAPTWAWNEADPAHLRRIFSKAGVRLIYANTITNGDILPELSWGRTPMITHVHELAYWINHRLNPDHLGQVLRFTDLFVAGSRAVKDNLTQNLKVASGRVEVVHEFIPTQDFSARLARAGEIRRGLGLPEEALVVGGAGTTDWRKGPDLFIQLARLVKERISSPPVRFVWVGGAKDGPEWAALRHDVELAGLDGTVLFLGHRPDYLDCLAALDVFVLTSREDAFPLVNLEAAALEKPVVCFDRAGGSPEFVGSDCGFVVPYLDLAAMADRVAALLADPALRQRLGRQGAQKVRREHDVTVAGPRISGLIEKILSDPNL